MDRARIDAFMSDFVGFAAGATTIALLALADRSGINGYMAAVDSADVDTISGSTGLESRYVKEILSGLTAAGVYEYQPESGEFSLPAEHALLIADESSPYFMGGWLDMIPIGFEHLDGILDATRNGGGVGYEEFGDRMTKAIARANEPSQKVLLASRWIGSIPVVAQKLKSGARVADVGCGSGSATIAMATAYPESTFVGFDLSETAITEARLAADDLDNVVFEQQAVEAIPADSGFDVITAFDVVHDLTHPLTGLSRIRQALTDDGVFLMMEPAASSSLEENLNPRAALLYGISTLHCMTQSLARGGEGVGAAWGRQAIEALAAEAGFGSIEHLEDISNTFSDFFLLSG